MDIKQYKEIDNTLAPYWHLLGQAVDTVMDQEVSKYPILVIQDGALELGIPLIEKDTIVIHVSTLEEFAARQVIPIEKVEDFKSTYKDPRYHFCFFRFDIQGQKHEFLFRPRPDKPVDASE